MDFAYGVGDGAVGMGKSVGLIMVKLLTVYALMLL